MQRHTVALYLSETAKHFYCIYVHKLFEIVTAGPSTIVYYRLNVFTIRLVFKTKNNQLLMQIC